jgi:MFS superfamily sulfate permease-like transporter
LTAIKHAAQDPVRVVILVLKRARNPDAAFLNLLRTFHMNLRQRNIVLLLAGVQAELRKALAGTGFDARIGLQNIFSYRPNPWSSTADAVQYAYKLLGDELCSTCPRRQETACISQPLDYEI